MEPLVVVVWGHAMNHIMHKKACHPPRHSYTLLVLARSVVVQLVVCISSSQ